MKDVKYFSPTKVDEAVGLLAQYGEQAVVLAGGTDLVPKINYYDVKPEVILYIGKLGLDKIQKKDGKLIIGACVTTAQLLQDPLVHEHATALSVAAFQHSSPSIVNAATVGGNIANASPAADLVPPLLALDASVHVAGPQGEREIALDKFFVGAGKTVLAQGEIILDIHIPVVKGKTTFAKVGKRKHAGIAVASVGVRLNIEAGVIQEARVAVGSMAATPLRCYKAEEMLVGKQPTAELFAACAKEAVAQCSPIDDQRATAWYRKTTGAAIIARALAKAAGLNS